MVKPAHGFANDKTRGLVTFPEGYEVGEKRM